MSTATQIETLTPSQIADNVEAWVKALESGEYRQGRLRLMRDGRYCCLGVGCEVLIQRGIPIQKRSSGPEFLFDGSSAMLPGAAMFALGIRSDAGKYFQAHEEKTLTGRNDSDVPFVSIAKIIRSMPTALFTPEVESELRSRGWGTDAR